MTGRAAGYCAGYSVPGFMNPIAGRGFGWGGGRGFGWGRGRGWGRGQGRGQWGFGGPGLAWPGYAAPPPAAVSGEQEVQALKQQSEYFEQALGEIRARLDQLQSQQEQA